MPLGLRPSPEDCFDKAANMNVLAFIEHLVNQFLKFCADVTVTGVCNVIVLVGFVIACLAALRKFTEDHRPRYDAIVIKSEEYARRASKAVHRAWNEDLSLSEQEYWQIVQRNGEVLVSILDRSDNKMVAFFDVFPLKKEVAEAFLEGRTSERTLLTADSVLDPQDAKQADYIYLGTVLAFPSAFRKSEKLQMEFSLLRPLLSYVVHRYPPRPGRIYFALGASRLGDEWLKQCKFTPRARPEAKKQRLVYELHSERLGLAQRVARKLNPGESRGKLTPIQCSWKSTWFFLRKSAPGAGT
jgi:hypothetical protein